MKRLTIEVSRRLEAYLYALVAEEGWGDDPGEVALGFIWRGVHEQLACGTIARLEPGWPAPVHPATKETP